MSINYVVNDRAFFCDQYGKYYRHDTGEYIESRIRLERIVISEQAQTYKLRISRKPTDYTIAKCFIHDRYMGFGQNFQYESEVYPSYINLYIYNYHHTISGNSIVDCDQICLKNHKK